MTSKPRWTLSFTQGVLGLLCLGVVLACDSGEGGESEITELIGTPVIADGTYQLDNLSLNDNGSLVSYGLTIADGSKWETATGYTPLQAELRWLGDELCPTITGENEKCDEGTYQLTTSGSAYFYIGNETREWSQQAYVKAANNDANDRFGASVALDSGTLAVSAYNEDSSQTTITNGTTASSDDSSSNSGAVYFYKVE